MGQEIHLSIQPQPPAEILRVVRDALGGLARPISCFLTPQVSLPEAETCPSHCRPGPSSPPLSSRAVPKACWDVRSPCSQGTSVCRGVVAEGNMVGTRRFLVPPHIIARERGRETLLGRRGSPWRRKCGWGSHQVLLLPGEWVYVSGFFYLLWHSALLLIFSLFLITVSSKLFSSRPLIFAFCPSSWRGKGATQSDFSGCVKLGNTILKPQQGSISCAVSKRDSRKLCLGVHRKAAIVLWALFLHFPCFVIFTFSSIFLLLLM